MSDAASPSAPPAAPTLASTAGTAALAAGGDWTLASAPALERLLGGLRADALPAATPALDATGVARMDSTGAMLLARALARLGLGADAVALRPEHRRLLEALQGLCDGRASPPRKDYGLHALLARAGFAVEDNAREILALVAFLGRTLQGLARVAAQPARLRLTATVHHMEEVGLNAVPLVLLLSFLVGAVIAFLGATVLADFGAALFVVELVSFAFLREFGVLLTAILLAGRTASAFTAQIGAMKAREEIDAIRTLGLDPVELLVIPRLLALLVMLPLLSFLAVCAGLLGGMVVCASTLAIPADLFFSRLTETIQLRHLWVGLSKAPLFAVVIALIGCLEGFQVQGSAQSVGERTTSSVVQCIALVIVIDALAAIFFMEMHW